MKKQVNWAMVKIYVTLVMACVFIVGLSVSSLGEILSDQGTNVKYQTNSSLVSDADLNVSVWDAATGGNLIYNETFSNAVQDGAWNVMLGAGSYSMTLNYNQVYYRDYQINGEDIDFINDSGSVVERQEFQAAVGNLSQAAWANSFITSDNVSSLSIDWSQLTSVPAGLADGDDAGVNYSNIFTVSPNGDAQFTTIQAAIDAVSGESATNQSLIRIHPGVYNEQLTVPAYVHLLGETGYDRGVQIQSSTFPVINMSGSGQSYIRHVYVNASITTNQTNCMIHLENGQKAVFFSDVRLTATNSYGCVVNATNTLPFISRGTNWFYTQEGDVPGGHDHTIMKISGLNSYTLDASVFSMTLNSADDNGTIVKEYSGALTSLTAQGNTMTINIENSSYTGRSRIYCDEATSALSATSRKTWNSNIITINGDGSSGSQGVAMCLSQSNSAVENMGNQIKVSGMALNNFYAAVGPSSTFDSYFDEVEAADGIWSGSAGTYNYVNSPSPGDIQISGSYLNMYNNTVIVNQRGGDYQTIQAAIDSITTAGENNPFVVQVYPGVYNEQITMKDYVSLRGMGAWARQVEITNTTMPLIRWNNTGRSSISNIHFTSNVSADTDVCMLEVTSGAKNLMDSVVTLNAFSAKACLINVSGVQPFISNRIGLYYTQTGEVSGQQQSNLITLGHLSISKLQSWVLSGTATTSNDNVTIIKSLGTNTFLVANSEFSMDTTNTSYSGYSRLLCEEASDIPGYEKHIIGTIIDIESDGNGGVGVAYCMAASQSTLRTSGNNILVDGFPTEYVAGIGPNGFLYSRFDASIADNGTNGPVANYEYVTSQAPGELTVTDSIEVGTGSDIEQDLIEVLIGSSPNPRFRYDNNWFGFSALLWDFEGAESTFGIESTDDTAQLLLVTNGTGGQNQNQQITFGGYSSGVGKTWQVGRFGADSDDFVFRPAGSLLNAPLTLGYDLPYGIKLRAGAEVNNTLTNISGSPTDFDLATAAAIKTYVDDSIAGLSGDTNETTRVDALYTNISKFLNNTQLSEAQVDAFVDNNGYVNATGTNQLNGTYNWTGDSHIIYNNVHLGNLQYGLTTGLITGGGLTINATNSSILDVEAGTGLIADYSDPANPVVTEVSWSASEEFPNIAGQRSKWVGVQDVGGGVGDIVFATSFTQAQKRTTIILGRVWGDGTDAMTGRGEYATSIYGKAEALEDLTYTLGSLNKEGNVFSANANEGLRLDRSAGEAFRWASAHGSTPESPHYRVDSASINISTYNYHVQNSTSVTVETEIDPDNYDLNGVKTAVPAGNFTVQRIYYFAGSKTVHVTYGQALYDNLQDATTGISDESVTLNSDILEGSMLRAFLVVRAGTTNLSNTTNTSIVAYTGFSTGTGGGGGATVEADPIFAASAAYGIAAADITNWDTAFGWGDHGTEGYVKNSSDANFNILKSNDWTNVSITEAQISDLSHTTDTNETTRVDALYANITAFLLDTNETSRVDALYANITAFLQDTTYSSLSEFTNDVGYFDNIANFTGTLTDTYHCRYDLANGEIDCDVDTSGWDQNAADDFDGAYSSLTGSPLFLTNFTDNFGYFSNLANFTGTLTDEYLCSYEATGTQIDCDTDASGWDQNAADDFTSDQTLNTTSAVTFQNISSTGNITITGAGGCLTLPGGGFMCSNSSHTWIG